MKSYEVKRISIKKRLALCSNILLVMQCYYLKLKSINILSLTFAGTLVSITNNRMGEVIRLVKWNFCTQKLTFG